MEEAPYLAFIVPDDSGIEYEQQTGGVACTRRCIKGNAILLSRYRWNYEVWCRLIQNLNYGGEEGTIKIGPLTFNGVLYNRERWMGEWDEQAFDVKEGTGYVGKVVSLIDYCWLRIKSETGWDWEIVPHPENTEAFEWVRITEVPSPIPEEDSDYSWMIGKEVVLVYPNCD